MKKIYYAAIILICLLNLSACTNQLATAQAGKFNSVLQGTGVIIQNQTNQLTIILPAEVSFKPGGTRLNAKAYPLLMKIAAVLQKDYPNANIKVAGFTDNSGSPMRNRSLALIRARAVASYLRYRGINREQINVVGFGDEKPVATNTTVEGRAQNRRVEIYIANN